MNRQTAASLHHICKGAIRNRPHRRCIFEAVVAEAETVMPRSPDKNTVVNSLFTDWPHSDHS